MSETAAIICEYNPFHNGHKLQIELLRNAYPGVRVIAVMSGSVVQRGETAVLPKRLRAEAAVKCGADLVLELPYPYSGAAAEYFASGAVRLIAGLGCVDLLCFGSESGDLLSLNKTAENLMSDAYSIEYEKRRAQKDSGAVSRLSLGEAAYNDLFGEGYPKTPNDILAVEYIKALKGYGGGIEPFTYGRKPGYSATLSRNALRNGRYDELEALVPEKAFELYRSYGGFDLPERAEAVVLSALRLFGDRCHMEDCACAGGGIYQLLKNSADKASSLDSLISMCSGKRYTDANIRRAIISMLLGTTSDMLLEKPLFTNVLAANATGREILSDIRKTADIAVVTKQAHYSRLPENAREQFKRNFDADRLYLLTAHKRMSPSELLLLPPYIE